MSNQTTLTLHRDGLKRRPDIWDVPVLIGAAVLAFAVAYFFDLPPVLSFLGLNVPDWLADDAVFVIFVLMSCLLIYGFRRNKELSWEIKARISAEQEAHGLARHDPLTGLPNRRFFNESLEEGLGAVSGAHQLAVFMLGLLRSRPTSLGRET